jgi:hypothetical protein
MNLKNVKKVKPTSNNISVIRTVTPLSHFIQNKNKINFTSNNSNNELSAISNTNLNITFFDINQSNKKAKKNKYSSSVSPQIERNNNIQNKCYDILKSRSISKKKIDKYCQMLSNYSKTKIEKKSKSISKGKKSSKNKTNNICNVNKKIPLLNNNNKTNIKRFPVNASKESINTNYTVTSIHSNNLTENEKMTLCKIQNMLFNLISNSQNPKEILKEFELINQRTLSYSSKYCNTEENVNNKFNQINLKFKEIENENKELKNLLKEKVSDFEDVKISIKNVQKEINLMKKNNKQEEKTKKMNNNNNKNLSMKNVNINLQTIQKVNGIEDLKSEKSKNSNNDTIIHSFKDDNNENKFNFNGLDSYSKNFNDVFLSNYNEFSASWRNDADKIMERRNEK